MNNRKTALKIPPFLSKLFEIVSNAEYKNIITWSSEGDAFVIPDLSSFCDQILPRYFKHSNFASFVRQLNMYDFHKTKYSNVEQAFQHKYFLNNNYDLLGQIKRKNYNETLKKSAHHSRKKKIDFDTLKRDSISFSMQLEDLKKRVDTLEGKHSYLEICHTDLAQKNQKIKIQLNSLIQKEKELEHYLILAMKNFSPNFFLKNSELKYFDNLLTEGNVESNVTSNQLIELNKSTYQKNDIINKIFKNLYNYCYLVKTADTNDSPDIKPALPIKFNKKSEIDKSSKLATNNPDQPELNYYNNVRDFQNRVYNYFDVENTVNNNNINPHITKIFPRRSEGVQIIENDYDYEVKQEDLPIPNSGMFEIVQNNLGNIPEAKSNLLLNKRKRINLKTDFYDKIHADSNYKLEKQE